MIDPLEDRIQSYIRIKEIGVVMRDCADYVIRIYLARKWKQGDQYRMAEDIFASLAKRMNKTGHVDSLVYKTIELGELLMCLEEHKKCKYAKECWITRKGFAVCTEKRVRRFNARLKKNS